MKSTKLLTILSIGIASWMHSCIEKKKTSDKEVTAEACKKKQMKFNETDKKCVAPDEAFCSGLSLGFQKSPAACIAKNGTGGTDTGGSNIDTNVDLKFDPSGNALTATVGGTAGHISLQPKANNTDRYIMKIWVAKDSNCTIESLPHNSNSIPIRASAPAGTKECKIKFLAINHDKKKYNVSKEYIIEFN